MPKREKSLVRQEKQTLAVDPQAQSAVPGVPAYLARPSGTPVYYGFPILEDVDVEGFKLGKITDFEQDPEASTGDSFIVAPDGSRAGLVWEVSDLQYVLPVRAMEEERWGVWAVGLPYPMRSRETARQNLQALLPQLKEHWETWKKQYAK